MANGDYDFVVDFRRREMAGSVFARAVAAAADIRGRFGDSVAAVLFYGSCLRLGDDRDKILDFYIIVDDYARAYSRFPLAWLNRLLPPNVFYAETDGSDGVIRSKFAVLSLSDLARRTTPQSLEVTFWARFAQPVALVHVRDDNARSRVAEALAAAVLTLAGATAPLMPRRFSDGEFWGQAFAQTYRAELRSESGGKPDELYRLFAARYDALTLPALRAAGFDAARDETNNLRLSADRAGGRARRLWALRRAHGKMRSVLRLVKAAFTFDGGADYLAWKISRHSGVEITLTPWQTRHPVLTGLMLFWRMRRKGAFK